MSSANNLTVAHKKVSKSNNFQELFKRNFLTDDRIVKENQKVAEKVENKI